MEWLTIEVEEAKERDVDHSIVVLKVSLQTIVVPREFKEPAR